MGINFREQVENMSLNIRLSPTLQRFKERQPYYGSRRDANTVFVTMYLPSTISDIAVRKAFMQFGDVHTVFARQFKDDLYGIHNGKGHIRTHSIKRNMTSHMKSSSLVTLDSSR